MHHHVEAIQNGMTDHELKTALTSVLGIFGGSGGPNRYSVSFSGSGLRIWGGWHVVNHVTEKPLFACKLTIAKARDIHRIIDLMARQMTLL